jgi:predicted acetyltransferase
MPTLVQPTSDVRVSYLAAIDEFHAEGRYLHLDTPTLADPGRFRVFVAGRLAAAASGTPRGPYRVPETVLWYVEGDRFLGHLSIRHELNQWLFEQGGHIGYDVRPSARRRGHATAMLVLSLPIAHAMNIDPALVTCLSENVASRTVIERCGGVFEDMRYGRRRYWMATAPATSTSEARQL